MMQMEIERLRGMVEMLALTVARQAGTTVYSGGDPNRYQRDLGRVDFAREINDAMKLLTSCLDDKVADSPAEEEP
jgi:hypothetical protein